MNEEEEEIDLALALLDFKLELDLFNRETLIEDESLEFCL